MKQFSETCPKLELDVFMTRAGAEVASMYGMTESIERAATSVTRESSYSSRHIVRFASGRYGLLVVAPATSNTVAKCALGIADSLASSFLAQAGKSGVQAVVLPTDVEKEMVSCTPSGKPLNIRPRDIDLRMTDALSLIENVTVVKSPNELRRVVDKILMRSKKETDLLED